MWSLKDTIYFYRIVTGYTTYSENDGTTKIKLKR